MKNNTADAIRKKIITILDRYIGKEYILFLFGSFAVKQYDITSDFDLAVYAQKPISPSIITEAREALESGAGTLRNIDLVNLTDKNISCKLLENILKQGVLWKEMKNSEELLRSLKRHLRNLKR